MECGTLNVPLDYRNPNGRTIDIAVSRIKSSRPDLRRGVLLLNPGGPGAQGLDMPRAGLILFPQSVSTRYDLIGFDPRGIGRSNPVSCGLSALVTLQIFPPLEQPGGFQATADFMRNAADACAAVSGDLLPFITTRNTARDMDRLRQALGEQKISYLGYSYGTYLGTVYAQLFPTRTDRFVLDSAVNPNAVWRTQF
ncbi:MAG: alpha/beta fold hydrolase, partial [Steroidobacteraceae bacterium]